MNISLYHWIIYHQFIYEVHPKTYRYSVQNDQAYTPSQQSPVTHTNKCYRKLQLTTAVQ